MPESRSVMDPLKICSDLVRLRSENPPGNTSGPIEYIRELLESLGIRSEVTTAAGGRNNLITSGKHRFFLCGHVDVVPALDDGWTHSPFSGDIEEGYVWGRGASDMKGGCAAILAAVATRIESGQDLPATLAFVCDEETGGENGIRFLLAKNMVHPGDCLIAEPSPALHPCIGQKGLCRLDIRFSGTPAHGSLYPLVGVSAVMEAMQLLNYVKQVSENVIPMDGYIRELVRTSSQVFSEEFRIENGNEILERVTFNPGVIKGGEKVNIVAQHCDLSLEMRIPWGCDIPSLIHGIMAYVPHGTITRQEIHEPSLTDPCCEFASIVCKAVEKVQGAPASPILQWAASDARHLRSAGFRVIEYGPGELPTIHGVNERVSADSLEKASSVYSEVLEAYGSEPQRQ